MKTVGKVIVSILLVALLLAGVGLIWRYTNGFNENFRTFYVEYGGEKILTASSSLELTGGTEARFDVGYTFDLTDDEPRGYGVKIAANAEEDFDFTADGKNYAWSRQTDITEAFDIERGEDYFVLNLPLDCSPKDILGTLYDGAEIETGPLSETARYYTLVVSSYNGEEVCEIDFSIHDPRYAIGYMMEADGSVYGTLDVEVAEKAMAGETVEFTVNWQGESELHRLTGVGIRGEDGEVQPLTEENGKYSFVMPERDVTIVVQTKYRSVWTYSIGYRMEADGSVYGDLDVEVADSADIGETVEFTVDWKGESEFHRLTGVGIRVGDGEVQLLTEEDGKYSFVMPEGDVTIIVYVQYRNP